MKKDLQWKFDISTFRLLGRELITDKITALVELVKNSYDANARRVDIKFIHTGEDCKACIIIKDDGVGMSSEDIENKWMRIGTASKRTESYSPKPFLRRYVGEKGIGRFAIDKLGSDCSILGKKSDENYANRLSINWNEYSSNENDDDFTEVNNKLVSRKLNSPISGVKLTIKEAHDVWSEYDVDRVYKEMSKIVSPLHKLNEPFDIFIQATGFKKYQTPRLVVNEAIKYASEEFLISHGELGGKHFQEEIQFENGEIKVKRGLPRVFGYLKMKLYYFDQGAKGNFAKNYKGSELQIDGLKIYRDGILATPFAQDEPDANKQRDILGIDKRRYSGFFDKIASRDMIGIIEISKDTSPNIIDATNRQDFIDNEAYRDLKVFIIEQIVELEKYLTHQKKSEYARADGNLKNARETLGDFSQKLKELKSDLSKGGVEASKINDEIRALQQSARKADIALKTGIKQQNKERKDSLRKEEMFMSLMSLQTYALEITHIIKTSLGNIKRRAEFNNKYYGLEKYEALIKKYNESIVTEMDKLDYAVDYMSTYTKADQNWSYFDIKTSIENVFLAHEMIFHKESIKVELLVDKNLKINYNNVLFEDILRNLISNSIKAFSNALFKLIKVTAYSESSGLIILFSDNGKGIPEKDRDRIFEIFHTTTSEEGGNGMGLYMVKANLMALKGNVEVIDSELGNGASLKLTFPFKRKP